MRTVFALVVAMSLASTVYADDPAAQAPPQQRDRPQEFRSFGYARLGYGGAFADAFRPGSGIGFGFRGETGSYAVDVSFLNFVIGSEPYGGGANVFAGSTLKLQGLRFLNPRANRSAYAGGGLSWGFMNAGGGSSTSSGYVSSWHGSGLQGELTTGYEFRGNTPLRAFVQADVGLPLYRAMAESYTFMSGPGLPMRTVERRYIPSLVISLGLGWDGRIRRP